MNLDHLRYFTTLAHIEHYTKASEFLHISQPTLTYAVNQLEKEVGVLLFEKDGRNIVLTKFGKLFLEEVEKSLNILDNSIKSLKLAGKGEGNIDVGSLRTLETKFLPDIISRFLSEKKEKDVYKRQVFPGSFNVQLAP